MKWEEGAIVVPLDGSKNSEAALLPALQFARAYESPLRFLHVVDIESTDIHAREELPEDRFETYVRGLLGQSGVADVEWSAAIAVGSPASTILEKAEGVRVVVMGTHGRGGFQATFIGSVTDKVVRSCQVPVLTVPGEGQANLMSGPVVVGLDGSEAAEAALPVVRDLAQRLGVGIALVRAYSATPSTGTDFVLYEYNAIEIMKAAAEEYLAGVAREGEQTLTALMAPAPAIEMASSQLGAGLVALTSHGRSLAYRLALGSTTDRVIHSVRRPILVLPI